MPQVAADPELAEEILSILPMTGLFHRNEILQKLLKLEGAFKQRNFSAPEKALSRYLGFIRNAKKIYLVGRGQNRVYYSCEARLAGRDDVIPTIPRTYRNAKYYYADKEATKEAARKPLGPFTALMQAWGNGKLLSPAPFVPVPGCGRWKFGLPTENNHAQR